MFTRRTGRNSWLVLVLLLLTGDSAPAQDHGVALTGVTLIDGTGAPARAGMTIQMRDGLVTHVGPSTETTLPEGTRVIDGAGKYVIPGLADMHVHFGRGLGLPNSPDGVDDVLRQFVSYGVTSVLNLGAYFGRADQIETLRKRREAGEVIAPHIYATGGLLAVPGSHPINRWKRSLPDSVDAEAYDWSRRGVWVVRSPEDVSEVVTRMAAAGMDGIKVVIDSEMRAPPGKARSPMISMEMLDAAVQEARNRGLPVLAHASGPRELENALDAGVHAVVHLGGEPAGADLRERMRRQGVYLVPTLSVYVWADTWGDPEDNLTDPFLHRGVEEGVIEAARAWPLAPTTAPTEEDWAWRRNFLAGLQVARDAGVKLVAGTDAPAGLNFHGYSMHRELEFLVEAGLTPMEALMSATSGAAELLGQEDVFGTIQPGMRADLLILAADPLDDIRNTRTLEMVVMDGEVIEASSLQPGR